MRVGIYVYVELVSPQSVQLRRKFSSSNRATLTPDKANHLIFQLILSESMVLSHNRASNIGKNNTKVNRISFFNLLINNTLFMIKDLTLMTTAPFYSCSILSSFHGDAKW